MKENTMIVVGADNDDEIWMATGELRMFWPSVLSSSGARLQAQYHNPRNGDCIWKDVPSVYGDDMRTDP